jgi:hypothetical protein
MSIAGHVSRAMLSRYSHVRMEAKRRALDEIATRQGVSVQSRMASRYTPRLVRYSAKIVRVDLLQMRNSGHVWNRSYALVEP